MKIKLEKTKTSETMKKIIFFFTVIFILINIKAQDGSKHIPWKLDGALERIEKIRKGEVVLEFYHENKRLKNKKGDFKIELISHNFNFGVSMTQSRDLFQTAKFELYRDRVKELFNFVTVGFYWVLFDDKVDTSYANKYMNDNLQWADKNNLRVKGHPLLWHESLPNWIIDFEDMEELEKIINNRISKLINSYPKIPYWDVYNEPVAPFKSHVHPSGITRWITHKGGIEPAMKYLYDLVNQINPTKKYVNNHYHPKEPEFIAINQYFIDENVNYTAIGMQAHMQTDSGVLSETDLWNLLEDYSKFEKEIHFTEITVTSSKRFKDWEEHKIYLKKRDDLLKQGKDLYLESQDEYEIYQAEYLKDFFTLAFSHPSLTSITIWNLTDLNAWRGHAGGILDKDFNPKKAFYTLKKLIKEDWSTKTEITQKIKKPIVFKGFYGDYLGEVTIEGKKYNFTFNHSADNTDTIRVIVQ
jgi:GH35 family endo-1,4-beta-xylanase